MLMNKKIISSTENIQTSLVFLDFETTGLNPNKDTIIEVGALKLYPNGKQEIFQSLINPNQPLLPIITQITHITDKMLENAPSLENQIPKLLKFINNTTIVAHNAKFDCKFLENTCKKLKLTYPKNNVICTLKIAKKRKEPQCSLTKLGEKYNIINKHAHRALDDAIATKDLYLKFNENHTEDYNKENTKKITKQQRTKL